MNRIDRLVVEKFDFSTAQLMEKAGEAVVKALQEITAPLSQKTIGVICGKGNNGGDGLVAARLLKKQKVSVVVVLTADLDALGSEAQNQYRKAKAAKVPVLILTGKDGLKPVQAALEVCDVLVDALLGTGLSRPVEGLIRDLIKSLNQLGKPILAVDVPSGLSADKGIPLGEAIRAQWTVTFGLPKVGFYMPTASVYTGKVQVAPIGFPEELLKDSFLKYELTGLDQVQKALPRYDDNTHKGTRGRVLVVAGATGLTGAAALAAWGAQRIGAGLVTVACAESLNPILASKLTECMTAPVPEVAGGFLSLRAATRILYLATNVNSIVIGPGIGRHGETGQLLKEILTKLTSPMVIDADALYLLGSQLDILKSVRAPVILTPHPGEAAWLLKTTVAEVEQNRLQVAKKIAAEYNVVLVLKGHHTIIANPQGDVRINSTGNRGLATGGTGDVLSGILGGLLAQRLSPYDAATVGVYLHGLAGEKASRRLGPDGLLAGDLLPLLPRLLRQVREKTMEPLCPSMPHSKPNGTPSLSSSKSRKRGSTTT